LDDKIQSLVENAFKNGVFRGIYQQNTGFIHKTAVFFAESLAWLGYSDIFALTIFYTN
jgi:hypothetical protein